MTNQLSKHLEFPLVSACVASYNNAKYIAETLDSIEKQTYPNIELIIVDDFSKDNSVEVIHQWLKKTNLPHKFIQNNANLGVCKTVNILLENSSGKYLSTIGSDDIMLPEKISTQVYLLENSSQEVGIVYSDAYLIGPEGQTYFSKFIQRHEQFLEIPQGNIFPALIKGNYIPIMSLLWKKECFDECGKFDENLFYEDYDMLLRIALKFKFVFSEFISVKYRIHGNNLHKQIHNISALESNFDMYFKHLGTMDGIYDTSIQDGLKYYLLKLYDLKSPNLKKYLQKYYSFFSNRSVLKLAFSSNISYYQLSRINSLFGNFLGNDI